MIPDIDNIGKPSLEALLNERKRIAELKKQSKTITENIQLTMELKKLDKQIASYDMKTRI